MSTILREDQYFDHEEDFCIAESTEAKNKLEDIFLKNRISYFIKPEKRSFLQKLLGKRKNSCVIRINSRDIRKASELVDGLAGIEIVGIEPEEDWSPNAKLQRMQEERERAEAGEYPENGEAGLGRDLYGSPEYAGDDADYEDIVEVEDGVYVRMDKAAEYERNRRGRYFDKFEDYAEPGAYDDTQNAAASKEPLYEDDDDDDEDEYDRSNIIVEVIRESDAGTGGAGKIGADAADEAGDTDGHEERKEEPDEDKG